MNRGSANDAQKLWKPSHEWMFCGKNKKKKRRNGCSGPGLQSSSFNEPLRLSRQEHVGATAAGRMFRESNSRIGDWGLPRRRLAKGSGLSGVYGSTAVDTMQHNPPQHHTCTYVHSPTSTLLMRSDARRLESSRHTTSILRVKTKKSIEVMKLKERRRAPKQEWHF